MPPYRIPPQFKKVLSKKERALQATIMECVVRLGEDPRHPSLRVHRVQGTSGVWEAYVDTANRVTYHWEGDTIVLRMNCNHDIIRRSP
jgi:hypothetical protein